MMKETQHHLYLQHFNMSQKKEDWCDEHLLRIAIFGWVQFSRQVSSDTWIYNNQLVIYLYGLEFQRLPDNVPSIY